MCYEKFGPMISLLIKFCAFAVRVYVSPLVKANNNDNDTIRLIDGNVNTSHWAKKF